MTTICISHTVWEDGQEYWSVLHNSCSATAARPDERGAREYARALYHKTRAPKRLEEWNGRETTVIEEVLR